MDAEARPLLGHASASGADVEPRVYRRRWSLLALFVVLTTSNNLTFLGFAPVLDEASVFFGRSTGTISLLPTIYMVSGVFNPFVGWLVERTSLGLVLVVAASLNAVGAVVRVGAVTLCTDPHSSAALVWLLVGQTLAALSQPIIGTVPPLLSDTWFADDERGVATGLGTAAVLAGLGLGFATSPQLVAAGAPADWLRFLVMPAALAAAVGVGLVAHVALGGGAPPTPPTSSSADRARAHDGALTLRAYGAMLRRCVGVPGFWALLIVFATYYGAASAMYASLSDALATPPRAVDARAAGYMQAGGIACGLVGAAVAGVYVDATRQYARALVVGALLTLSAAGALVAALTVVGVERALVAAAIVVFAAISTSLLPVAFELAVELTYPLPAEVSSGILTLGGGLLGAVALEALQALKAADDGRYRVALLAWLALLAAVLPLFGTVRHWRYRRLEAEQAQAEKAQ